MKHISANIRVPIEKDNLSICRLEEKCIKCGQCANVCRDFQSVVCPVGAIIGRQDYKTVRDIIASKSKIVIVSIAPSVRVALGDEFKLKSGKFVEGKVVSLLKKLGFDYVLDTNFGADMTIMEEAAELVSRLQKGKNLPLMTSCCPSWVKFVETFFPEFIANLSTCKSPISMQGTLIKTYFARKKNLQPKDIVNVTIAPCVAKKCEIKRKELCGSARFNKQRGYADNDFVLTTVELAEWAKEEGINFAKLPDGEFDDIMGQASGGGVIFGGSGGVMESALRTANFYITHAQPSGDLLNFDSVRGGQGIKVGQARLGDRLVKVAAVSGLANARKLLQRIKAGEKLDFVEVMACPGGCIGGGGQPKHIGDEDKIQRARAASLYARDKSLPVRAAHQNPQIKALYDEFLGAPNSKVAKALLHTSFIDRSGELSVKQKGEVSMKKVKYRCKVCGEIFEVEEGQEPVCPLCKCRGDKLEKL